MGLRERLRDFSRTPVEKQADELREQAFVEGGDDLTALAPRHPACVCGTVRTVTLPPRRSVPALVAEVWDGKGVVNLVWIGRRHIGGIEPGTFVHPIKQRWFATMTQFANEPTYVDGGDTPTRKKIYYHNDLDFGGCEGLVEVVAATDGLVVSVADKVLDGYSLTPAQPRYDVVYVVDGRGWFYRYSHLHTIAAGLKPAVPSVASLFVSRWDVATAQLPEGVRDKLGIAIAMRTYKAYRELLRSARWHQLATKGARPQRLLMASTGTKSKALPDTYYVTALAAEQTVNTMPEATLAAFADHGELRGVLAADGGDAEEMLKRIGAAGVDIDALGAELQIKGRDAFVASFAQLLERVAGKMEALRAA